MLRFTGASGWGSAIVGSVGTGISISTVQGVLPRHFKMAKPVGPLRRFLSGGVDGVEFVVKNGVMRPFRRRPHHPPVTPDMSVEVDDVDATYAVMRDSGAEIVHPLRDEEWDGNCDGSVTSGADADELPTSRVQCLV